MRISDWSSDVCSSDLLIAWLGWRAMMARPAIQGSAAPAAVAPAMAPPLRLLVVPFLLTMSNPTTILSFAALFAALGLAAGAPLHASVAAVAGVFAGSLRRSAGRLVGKEGVRTGR